MPRLLVENGVDRGKSYIIQKDGSFFAGRDKAAQVQIHDEMASRRHFQIEYNGGQYSIRDLQSANGTFLNGSLVRKVELLAPNDRIQVGSTLISFQDDKPHPLIGREISGYRILDRVGRGGMGTVYRALQTSLDRIVALKVLAPHLVRNSNFVNLFIREARAAGSLSHPNIVQVYDVGVHEDVYFFSMEYIPDGSVEDLLNRGGPIPLARALRIVHDAARGLEYAERLGIVHRDIKPGNLMVGANGVVKIGDLGISRSTDEEGQASQKDGVSGSPHYIAPEQARGDDIDTRADVYSLGVSLYQLLSGRTPFRGATPREVILKHLKEAPPLLTDLVENLPTDVAQLVSRMMAKDPDERVASASRLLEELFPLLRRYPADGTTGPASNSRKVRNLLLAVLGAASLMGVGFLTMAWYQDRQEEQRQLEAQLAGYTRELERVNELLSISDVAAARMALDSLESVDLSDEQQVEWSRLEAEAQRLSDQMAVEAREQVATTSAEELQSKQEESKLPDDAAWTERAEAFRVAATAWRELAEQHPETQAAARAVARAKELEAAAQQLTDRETRAMGEFAALLARYEIQVEKKHFRYALDLLREFESERHAGTAAHQQWIEAKNALQAMEELEFENVSRVVEALREEQRAGEAEVRLREFEDTIAFDSTRTNWEKLLAEVQSDLTGDGPGVSAEERASRQLATAYREAWQSWSESLDPEPAARRLADLKLRSLLPADLNRRLSTVRSWIRTWDQVFSELRGRQPTLDQFPIYLAAEVDARQAELVEIQEERVIYRIGEQLFRPDWKNLSPRGRAEIFLRVAATPDEQVFAGLLAHLASLTDEGNAVWQAAASADPAVEAILTELRFGLEAMKRLPR